MSGLMVTFGIGVAGGLGALARFLLGEWVARWWRTPFPLATLVINVTGAFALGVVTGAFSGSAGSAIRLVIGVGLLGGYTTFSTLSAETLALVRRSEGSMAWFNIGVSLLGGVVAAAAGLALGYAL